MTDIRKRKSPEGDLDDGLKKIALVQEDLHWWEEAIRSRIYRATLQHSGLAEAHIQSYNDLVVDWLKDIVLNMGKIDLVVETTRYNTRLANYRFVGSPITYQTAHSTNQTYTGTIVVDAVETIAHKSAEGVWVTASRKLVKDLTMCKVPLMVSSDACRSRDEPQFETEVELGGSFVIRGKRRYIPFVQGLMNNYPYRFYNSSKQQKYLQVRSCHLRNIHRSTSTLDLLLENEKIARNLTLRIPKLKIPFLPTTVSMSVILCVLGWKVSDFIMATQALMGNKWDSGKYAKYMVTLQGTWKHTDPSDAVSFLNSLYGKTNNHNTAAHITSTEVLPHLNDSKDVARGKGLYLAYMFGLLMQFEEGVIPESSRDSCEYKRIVRPGNSLAGLFRMLYVSFIRQGHKVIRRCIKQHQPLEILKIYKESRLTQRLNSAVATGTWSSKRKGVSHQLVTTNSHAIIGQLRRVSSSVLNSDGKHVLPRLVLADLYGYICAAETQEGEGCGLITSLACTARITQGTDHRVVAEILILALADNFVSSAVEIGQIQRDWYKLFDSMGMLLGFVRNVGSAVETFVHLRRGGSIDAFVGYSRDDSTQEMRFDCDFGRMVRPLLVLAQLGKIPWIFSHYPACPDLLRVLVAEGCVEYVSPVEEKHLQVSTCFSDAFGSTATHLEITDVSFVGINATLAPYFRHNQGPRLVYWIGMSKQSMFCAPAQDHGAVTMNQLWYGQKPVVNTASSCFLGLDSEATGINCSVVFFPLSYNQEDAIIINRSSVERGMFVSDMFKVYEHNRQISDNKKYDERIERPQERYTIGMKSGSYSGLQPNGIPKLGTILEPHDVIIGKTVPVKAFSPLAVLNGPKQFRTQGQQKDRRDTSVQLQPGERGVVHAIGDVSTDTSQTVKVTLRSTKVPETGDKFSSRHAQKGTIGRLESPENLPFSVQTGMIPDIVMSPLGFPSRMTMGKLLEILIGKAVCLSGDLEAGLDEQEFEGNGEEILGKMGKVLKSYGYEYSGKELFCDGVTGQMIEAHVMSGVVNYVKLHHMVSKKMHARATGPRHFLTHQPNEGKSANGGLRFGPMEVDCTIAHSAAEILRERMLTVSDEFHVYICSVCGYIADGNSDAGFFFCRYCKTGANVSSVVMPYASKLMLQELNAIGIKVQLSLTE